MLDPGVKPGMTGRGGAASQGAPSPVTRATVCQTDLAETASEYGSVRRCTKKNTSLFRRLSRAVNKPINPSAGVSHIRARAQLEALENRAEVTPENRAW